MMQQFPRRGIGSPVTFLRQGGSARAAVAKVAAKGRNGDTTLMHVSPREVRALRGIGGITTNPKTGLPEAWKWSDLLDYAAPVAAAFAAPYISSELFDNGQLFGSEALAKGVTAAGIGGLGSGLVGGNALKGALMGGLASGIGSAYNDVTAEGGAGAMRGMGSAAGTGVGGITSEDLPDPGTGVPSGAVPPGVGGGAPSVPPSLAQTAAPVGGSTAGAIGAPAGNPDPGSESWFNRIDLQRDVAKEAAGGPDGPSLLDRAWGYAKDHPIPVGMGALALGSALSKPKLPNVAQVAAPVSTPLEQRILLRQQVANQPTGTAFSTRRKAPGNGNGFYFNNVNGFQTLKRGGRVEGGGDLKAAARDVRAAGIGGDTVLAHINPREARILKLLGGSGRTNPNTGLPSYDDDDDDGPGGDGPGGDGPGGGPGSEGQSGADEGLDSNGGAPNGDPSGPGPSGPDGPSASDIDDMADQFNNNGYGDPLNDYTSDYEAAGVPGQSDLTQDPNFDKSQYSFLDRMWSQAQQKAPNFLANFAVNKIAPMAFGPLGAMFALGNTASGLLGGPTAGAAIVDAINNTDPSHSTPIDGPLNSEDGTTPDNSGPFAMSTQPAGPQGSGAPWLNPSYRSIMSPTGYVPDADFSAGKVSSPSPGDGFFFKNVNQYEPITKARGGTVRGISMSPGAVSGPGLIRGGSPDSDARSDDVNARVSKDEYIMDGETVALLGNGSSAAGARRLDQMRVNLRRHKGKALAKGKFSPNAKRPEQYIGKRGIG